MREPRGLLAGAGGVRCWFPSAAAQVVQAVKVVKAVKAVKVVKVAKVVKISERPRPATIGQALVPRELRGRWAPWSK